MSGRKETKRANLFSVRNFDGESNASRMQRQLQFVGRSRAPGGQEDADGTLRSEPERDVLRLGLNRFCRGHLKVLRSVEAQSGRVCPQKF